MEQEHFSPVPNELQTSKGPVKLASRLEARFLAHIDKKAIDWLYEPERIGKMKYFVDFYLPKLGIWVEVKGVIQPIDEIQLPQVAGVLKQRDELLFVYQSDNKAFWVTEKEKFEEIIHEELWKHMEVRQNWTPPIIEKAVDKPNNASPKLFTSSAALKKNTPPPLVLPADSAGRHKKNITLPSIPSVFETEGTQHKPSAVVAKVELAVSDIQLKSTKAEEISRKTQKTRERLNSKPRTYRFF